MATTNKNTGNKSAAKKGATKKASAPAEEIDIEIAVEPPKPLKVNFGGEIYTVRPIKGSLGISLGSQMKGVKGDTEKLQKALKRIVDIMFGPTDGAVIMARLDDQEDDLDFTHVMELLNKLVEKSTGNPTTSASD